MGGLGFQGLSFRAFRDYRDYRDLGFRVLAPMMENQMEKNMEKGNWDNVGVNEGTPLPKLQDV